MPTAIPGEGSGASRDRSTWGFALHAGQGNIHSPARLRGLRCKRALTHLLHLATRNSHKSLIPLEPLASNAKS